MVAPDKVRPTEHQIKENVIVVPRPFRDEYCLDLDWEDFTLEAFGTLREHRSLDVDRRVGVPMQGHVRCGDVLRLEVLDGVLHVRIDDTSDRPGETA